MVQQFSFWGETEGKRVERRWKGRQSPARRLLAGLKVCRVEAYEGAETVDLWALSSGFGQTGVIRATKEGLAIPGHSSTGGDGYASFGAA